MVSKSAYFAGFAACFYWLAVVFGQYRAGDVNAMYLAPIPVGAMLAMLWSIYESRKNKKAESKRYES